MKRKHQLTDNLSLTVIQKLNKYEPPAKSLKTDEKFLDNLEADLDLMIASDNLMEEVWGKLWHPPVFDGNLCRFMIWDELYDGSSSSQEWLWTRAQSEELGVEWKKLEYYYKRYFQDIKMDYTLDSLVTVAESIMKLHFKPQYKDKAFTHDYIQGLINTGNIVQFVGFFLPALYKLPIAKDEVIESGKF